MLGAVDIRWRSLARSLRKRQRAENVDLERLAERVILGSNVL
jgi:hypothetical protein